jgi:hypothetical protein
MSDPNPELTATFIPSMVRSAILFGDRNLSSQMLGGQIMRLLRSGLHKGEPRCK